jgi:hypothetical protein
MTEFSREFCKNDPKVLGKLFDMVKANHKVADHTEKVLVENRHVKDFCEEARHFIQLTGDKPLYIHYDVANWFKEPMGVQLKIESIGVYDDFLEYEKARLANITEGTTLN